MPKLTIRTRFDAAESVLMEDGIHPLLAKLFASRGITGKTDLPSSLSELLPMNELKGLGEAATILADGIEAGARMIIIGDYDCDGATATAVGVRGLRSMGADVQFLVPNRFELGYGLSPAIVELAAKVAPEILITVDNGINAIAGVAAARALGMTTVITDHHLPGDELPDADVIVNPNQPGCSFKSKSIAGVGVMFYVVLALRTELRNRNWFSEQGLIEPNLAELLDLVALGTIADVVRLDGNNRILVKQGLARIRAGKTQPGIRALFDVASRDSAKATTLDLGFAVGPRLNAAGRLTDMSVGIECLLADDAVRAYEIAKSLDALNRERRNIEGEMKEEAELQLEDIPDTSAGISLFDPSWHQGVIGLVAGRVKERTYRPTLAFARATGDGSSGEIKGSGRSIPSVHLRDVLDLITKRHPGLIIKFGGHAMAAGLTIRELDFEKMKAVFAETVAELVPSGGLEHVIETDGQIAPEFMTIDVTRMLDQEIWGQGFAPPLFYGEFDVIHKRVLKEAHMKLSLRVGGHIFNAIRFGCTDDPGTRAKVAFRLGLNEYNGAVSVQMMMEHYEAA